MRSRNSRPSARDLAQRAKQHRILPPAAIQPAEQDGAAGGNGSVRLIVSIVVGLAVVLIALAMMLVVVPRMSWRPIVATYGPYVRDGQVDRLTAAVPDSAQVFSEQNIKDKLYQGQGVRIVLVTKNDPQHGGQDWTDTLQVEPGKGFENPEPPQRRAEVQQMIGTVMAGIKGWEAHRSGSWIEEVILDASDGVNRPLRDQVDAILGSEQFALKGLLLKGDSVTLDLYKLSNVDYLDFRETMMSDGQDPQDVFAGLMPWFMQDQKSTKSTSLSTGLFNALKQNSGRKLRRIVIFSDGLENYPGEMGAKADFYRDNTFMDSTKWAMLTDVLTKFEKVPDLSGAVSIKWFAPHDHPELAPRIRAAQRFWKWLLVQRGHADPARVKMYY